MTWAPIPLHEIGRVVTGRTPPSAEPLCFGDYAPFLTPTDMSFDQRSVRTERGISSLGAQRFARTMVPAKAVSVVCIGATIGKACITTMPTLTNQQVNSVVCDSRKADPKFVYYSLRLRGDELRAKATGAATPIINKSAFEQLEIGLPSLDVQRRVSGILSAYDDLIEVNTRRIAIVEEMARRLFGEWFVQFRFPGHNRIRVVDTPIGRLPEGWKAGELQDVIVLQRGFDLPTTTRTPGPYPVVAATGIHGAHTAARVKAPSVVTGRSGSLGTVLHIDQDFWPLNTTLWGKQFPLGSTYHAFFVLRSIDLKARNAGAAVPTLNRNDIHKLPIPIPPRQVVKSFDAHVEPLFNFKSMLANTNAALRSARDLLLPKLMFGEIDLSHAERGLGATADQAAAE